MDVLIDNLPALLRGFRETLQLSAVAAVLALVLGVLLAAMRVSPVPALRWAGAGYVNTVRNTPLTLVYAFMAFAVPRLDFQLGPFRAAALALAVYTAAFVCEAVRSGVNAVPVGQAEAARAIGLTFGQTMQLVVLPQALRAVVPPLASVLIALAKNTSVAAGFGLLEATARMRGFTNNNADDRTLIFLTFAIGYIIIVEVISTGAFGLERRWKAAR